MVRKLLLYWVILKKVSADKEAIWFSYIYFFFRSLLKLAFY